MVKNFGVAKFWSQEQEYIKGANAWIKEKSGLLELDLFSEDKQIEQFFNSIKALRRQGPELVLGKLFDEIGFNKIDDPIFKQSLLYRL